MKLALLIVENGDSHYRHINCRIVEYHENQVKNPTYRYDDKPSYFYDDLTLSCQMDYHNPAPYAFNLRYQDVYSVNSDTACRMNKTLNRIEKALQKLSDEWGYPSNFDEYVIRFCKVLKIKTALTYSKKSNNGMYSDSEFVNSNTISDIRWTIKDMIHRNLDELKPKAA